MEDYKLEKSIYGWTMKIGNKSYWDVPEDYTLIIKQLEEENKKLKFAMRDTYDSANDTCGELQQRIDKAIKYIEEHTENIDRGKYYEDYVETYDLLNILRGENNDKSQNKSIIIK